MSLDKAIKNRRSIRKYKKDPVKKEQIESILDAGNKAPSAKNSQPWRFYVLQNEAKNKFMKYCFDEFEKIANDEDVHPYAKYSFNIMDEAPVVIIVYSAIKFEHPVRPDVQSASAAIQNMLLKAYDLGLGSLWIADVLYIDKKINEYFKTEMQLISAVTLGYANHTPKDIRKLSTEDVTTWKE